MTSSPVAHKTVSRVRRANGLSLCSVTLRDPGLHPKRVPLSAASVLTEGSVRKEWLEMFGGEYTEAAYEVMYSSRTIRRTWVRSLGQAEWRELGEFQDPRSAPRPGDALRGGGEVVRYKGRRDPDEGRYLAVVTCTFSPSGRRQAWLLRESEGWREVSRPLSRGGED